MCLCDVARTQDDGWDISSGDFASVTSERNNTRLTFPKYFAGSLNKQMVWRSLKAGTEVGRLVKDELHIPQIVTMSTNMIFKMSK